MCCFAALMSQHIAVDAAKDGEVAGQRRYPVVLIIDVHHQQIRGISPYFIRNVYGKGRVTSFVGSEQLAVEVHICQRIDSIKFQVSCLSRICAASVRNSFLYQEEALR